MGRRLGAVLIALGVVCVLLAFCLDASAAATADTGDGSVCQRTHLRVGGLPAQRTGAVAATGRNDIQNRPLCPAEASPVSGVFLHFIHHSSDFSPSGAFHFGGGRVIMWQIPPPEVPQ